MNQSTLTFAEVTSLLEAAQIPCLLKEYSIDNGKADYTIEFGHNWPEELLDITYNAFGGTLPKYVSLCGSSCGPKEIARRVIAGGPRDYGYSSSWG